MKASVVKTYFCLEVIYLDIYKGACMTTKKYLLRMPEELSRKVTDYSETSGISKARIIRTAIKYYMSVVLGEKEPSS